MNRRRFENSAALIPFAAAVCGWVLGPTSAFAALALDEASLGIPVSLAQTREISPSAVYTPSPSPAEDVPSSEAAGDPGPEEQFDSVMSVFAGSQSFIFGVDYGRLRMSVPVLDRYSRLYAGLDAEASRTYMWWQKPI
ncbi:MAG: hypothetical protein HYT89_02320, partial [Candidatus Omnitrophica bacterium]|nr:hypothetical protein [Candidatus Omnitrophota bacterium]